MNDWPYYLVMGGLVLVTAAKLYYLTAIYRQRLRAWELSQPKSQEPRICDECVPIYNKMYPRGDGPKSCIHAATLEEK